MTPQSFEEMLKAEGATDEDIKVLSTPAARKLWEKQQSAITAAETRATAAEKVGADWNEWYNQTLTPTVTELQNARLKAEGEAARNAAILKAATEQGLIDVAKLAGAEPDPKRVAATSVASPATSAAANGGDPDPRYITRDAATQLMDAEGEAIATVGDILGTHMELFGKPLTNFRELRTEAKQRRVPVEQVWREKYKVEERKQAIAAEAQRKHDDEIRADERQKVASQYGNPETRPLAPSNNPFTIRKPGSDGKQVQPWQTNENEAANARVARVTQKVISGTTQ